MCGGGKMGSGWEYIFITIFIKQYIDFKMESHHKQTTRKLYEQVLTNGVDAEAKKEPILSIIKMAICDSSHFSFLLNQVDWFSPPNRPLLPLLGKVLRAYRGTSKTAAKVVYNFLAGALCLPELNMLVVDLLVNLIHSFKDNIIAIESIRESYPHKLCELEVHIHYVDSLLKLCSKLPGERFHLLEIIVESLAAFDTETRLGQQYAHQIEFEDEAVLDLADECGELEHKYDQILSQVFAFLAHFDNAGKEAVLKEFYLIFQKVMMRVDSTKMIQYLAFYLAQASLQNCLSFIAMLMTTLIDSLSAQTKNKKIFLSSLQFLRSYICRSTVLPTKMGRKIFQSLIMQIQEKLADISIKGYETLNLTSFAEDHYSELYLLETVLFLQWKFPTFLANDTTRKSYNDLLGAATAKLHYQIFMNKDLMSAVGKEQPFDIHSNNTAYTTKYVDRFLPMYLVKSREYIKMKLNVRERRERPTWTLQESTEIQQSGNGLCRKMLNCNGGSTPITELNSC